MLPDRCKHYTGDVASHGCCAAGVKVRKAVGGSDDGWLLRTPCWRPGKTWPDGKTQEPACECSHFALPTAPEIEAEKAERAESFSHLMKARAAILDAGAKPRMAGELPCPVCSTGKLQWSMASNGHIHARCTTAGCVTWME